MNKHFDFSQREPEIYGQWESSGAFKASGQGEPYFIPMPPPNITGQLHAGHALGTALQDADIRYHRLQGYDALYLPGYDHAGLGAQTKILEAMAQAGIENPTEEQFNEFAQQWTDSTRERITEQLKRLGASADWDQARYTLDESYQEATAEAFRRLYDKGLIYYNNEDGQWYLKLSELAQPFIDALNRGELKIYPADAEKRLRQTPDGEPLEQARDWCISRQIMWGHQTPMWLSEDGQWFFGRTEEEAQQAMKDWGENPALINICQSPDRLDTWFSSALWNFAILGWPNWDWDTNITIWHPEKPEIFSREAKTQRAGDWYLSENEEANPMLAAWDGWILDQGYDDIDDMKADGWIETITSIPAHPYFPAAQLETGWDIMFFWAAKMSMMSLALTGQLPFKELYLHGLLRDENGEKQSKSKGNGIDPLQLADEYGADALRWALLANNDAGRDRNLQPDQLEAGRRLTNKLWNIGKFMDSDPWILTTIDRPKGRNDYYAIIELDNARADYDKAMANRDYRRAAEIARNFAWDYFSGELIPEYKERTSDSAEDSKMMHHIWAEALKMLHPFMPYITEALWEQLGTGTGMLINQRFYRPTEESIEQMGDSEADSIDQPDPWELPSIHESNDPDPRVVKDKLMQMLAVNPKFNELPGWMQERVRELVADLAVSREDYDWDFWSGEPQFDFVYEILIGDFGLPENPQEVIEAEIPAAHNEMGDEPDNFDETLSQDGFFVVYSAPDQQSLPVQYARLLAEMAATVDFTPDQIQALTESMDCDEAFLDEIFESAQVDFELKKAQICPPDGIFVGGDYEES